MMFNAVVKSTYIYISSNVTVLITAKLTGEGIPA